MNWNPEDYAQHSNAQLQWAHNLKSQLKLQGHESILDVGCGDGKITAEFATAVRYGRVVGIDSSAEMIAYAQQHYPVSQYPLLSFQCQDARLFSFSDKFDFVFSNAVLHWVDDHSAFLQRAFDALKPGGQMILSSGGIGNATDILQAFSQVIGRPIWSSFFDHFQNPYFFFGPQEYTIWLASFEVQKLELVPKDMTHKGRHGLESWIRTTWMPFTEKVPPDLRDRFVAEVVSHYLADHPIDELGMTHVKMVRLEVQALKPV